VADRASYSSTVAKIDKILAFLSPAFSNRFGHIEHRKIFAAAGDRMACDERDGNRKNTATAAD
jgi:hypothetical protein